MKRLSHLRLRIRRTRKPTKIRKIAKIKLTKRAPSKTELFGRTGSLRTICQLRFHQDLLQMP